MKNLYLLIVLLISFFGSMHIADGSYLDGDFKWVHDPAIIKHKDWYYLFSTGNGIHVKRSKDLYRWEPLNSVFKNNPNWALKAIPQVKDLWAPDISFFDNKFHLYYSVSSQGNGNRSAIGLAINKTLDPGDRDFNWIDKGLVIDSVPGRDDFNAIDPNVVIDENNKPWMAFGSFWDGIKLVRIDETTGKRFKGNSNIYSIASRNGGAVEAPYIVKKNGFYYLFVSFDKCCDGIQSTYRIMCGRSKKITGPYLDFFGKSMTEGGGSLVLAGYKHIRGPGHNSILFDKQKDYLIHHFYDGNSKGVMTLQVRRLYWLKNGWPVAGEPIKKNDNIQESFKLVGKWNLFVNYENEREIFFNDNGHINEINSSNIWELKNKNLILKWNLNNSEKTFIDNCIISDDGRFFVGRNQFGAVILGRR